MTQRHQFYLNSSFKQFHKFSLNKGNSRLLELCAKGVPECVCFTEKIAKGTRRSRHAFFQLSDQEIFFRIFPNNFTEKLPHLLAGRTTYKEREIFAFGQAWSNESAIVFYVFVSPRKSSGLLRETETSSSCFFVFWNDSGCERFVTHPGQTQMPGSRQLRGSSVSGSQFQTTGTGSQENLDIAFNCALIQVPLWFCHVCCFFFQRPLFYW